MLCPNFMASRFAILSGDGFDRERECPPEASVALRTREGEA
jgi:hypothetical protein